MGKKLRQASDRAGLVTAIEPVPTDPTCRRIVVDGKSAATLRDSEVDALGIKVGTRWTASLARKVEATVAHGKARTKALNMLGRRACTHGEIVAGLEKASFDTSIARAVADELVEQGWVDEVQLAAHAARALSKRHVVHEVIEEKLRARQLPEELAEKATSAALADVDRIERATRLIRQKLAGRRSAPTEKDIHRILGALSRKGFEADDVAAAFRTVGIDVDAMLNGWRD